MSNSFNSQNPNYQVEFSNECGQHTLAELWRDNYKALVGFATQILGSNLAADDIVTESFLKLWNNRQNFDDRRKVQCFLYTTTRNACIDVFRQQKIQDRAMDSLSHSTEAIEYERLDHYNSQYPWYLKKIASHAIRLPEHCRLVFECYLFEGMTTKQIALKFKVAEQTVRNHKIKAIRLLQSFKLSDE